MSVYFRITLASLLCLACCSLTTAAEPAAKAESVPLTRDDMKRTLDASKESVPRLPLPPVTDEEKAFIAEQEAKAKATGEKPRRFGLANNGRMRAYYLPEYGFQRTNDLERARAGTNRNSDSGLDQDLRTMIFWIVSRGNNCIYCLGHQESSLSSRGITDDQLAALDGDWAEFDEAKQATFKFATKLSFQPYAMNDDDIKVLRKHYNDAQIVDLIMATAGFNSTNRWTGPLRIKQDVLFPFVRPTSDKYASKVSRFAPIGATQVGHGSLEPTSRERPSLEPRAAVMAALEAAKVRSPRVNLVPESRPLGKRIAGTEEPAKPQWIQLLSTLPKGGAERIASYQAVLDKGTLEPRTKAIIAYVGARHDRAWYALGHAMQRLKQVGFSDDQIFALDQPGKLESDADREVAKFARTITVDPALVTDDDFNRIRKLFGDKKTAEIVYVTTQAAFFDRLTEAAALPLEQ